MRCRNAISALTNFLVVAGEERRRCRSWERRILWERGLVMVGIGVVEMGEEGMSWDMSVDLLLSGIFSETSTADPSFSVWSAISTVCVVVILRMVSR